MTLFMVNKLFKLQSMTENVLKMIRFCHPCYESADNCMREVATIGCHANMTSVSIRTQITTTFTNAKSHELIMSTFFSMRKA
jgi:hypothetical protein